VARRDTHCAGETERDTLRGLVRRPGVQLLLGLVAGLQVVAVQNASRAGEAIPTSVAAVLQPVVVKPSAETRTEREVEELTAEYREQGFAVTEELAEEIHAAAVENGIEPRVAFGLVRAESSFRNVATSRVGAVGLTQLMPRTAAWLEPGTTRSDLRDPETNLRIGFKYLAQLIEKYEGDVGLALTAYNRGPGTVDRALKRGRDPDNGYAAFVYGKKNHGHRLFTR
jgi:soluble lytic murein transglycosylase-like protein